MPLPSIHNLRSSIRKERLRTIAIVSVIGVIVGPLYAAILKGDFAGYRLLKGALMGLLITSISSTLELFIFPKIFRRLKFSILLVVRSLFYILLTGGSIILVSAAYESITRGIGFLSYLTGEENAAFLRGDFIKISIFATLASFTINFIWQINRLLGQGVLLSYITGRYFHPREEERIFMFLDLKSSTTIAERLGTTRFSAMLNDFFFDITAPILECKGEIYQYVGDEVVISWRMKRGVADANALRCLFLIDAAIASEGEKYIAKYGFLPEYKAGAHVGDVVISEIGEVKREIVFHGDTMNTTARIQSECNRLGSRLLVSEALLDRIELPAGLEATHMGAIQLRGKERALDLYGIAECDRPTSPARRRETQPRRRAPRR